MYNPQTSIDTVWHFWHTMFEFNADILFHREYQNRSKMAVSVKYEEAGLF